MNRPVRIALAWGVHGFTAMGILLVFASIPLVFEGRYLLVFWLNLVAIGIDSVDGILARAAKVKDYAPGIDGALMDNIIDFGTYTLVPALIIFHNGLIADEWKVVTVVALLLASLYAFSQSDAKSDDHFFVGFPSYWNLVVLYLMAWGWGQGVNLVIIWLCIVLSFVPIKFIYPSRLENLSPTPWVRRLFASLTLGWGAATVWLLISWPDAPAMVDAYIAGYILVYVGWSLWKSYGDQKS